MSGPQSKSRAVWVWVLRFLAVFSLIAFAGSPAAAQQETAEEKAKRAQIISQKTMSPFCPGRTLNDCPSPYATKWRRDIREMVKQGMSTDEIRRALEQRTPQDLSGAPSTALDSVLPVLVTVGAVLLLVLLLRMLLKARHEPALAAGPKSNTLKEEKQPSRQASDDDLEKRLTAELDNLDQDSLDDRA